MAQQLSPFYANAYLLQSAEFLWRASVAEKRTYPLPEHALNATLFVAFAAEAYINTALDLVLGKDDAEALFALRAKDRWTLGTRLAFGSSVFHAGEEPHQTIVKVFRERNRLVHASSLPVQYFDTSEETHPDLPTVARFILRVSQAVDELGRQAPELDQLRLVPGPLLKFDTHLSRYEPARHAEDLHRVVRALRVKLAEHEFGTAKELVEDFGEDEAGMYWTREEDIEDRFPD
jgi:hypothetical protein